MKKLLFYTMIVMVLVLTVLSIHPTLAQTQTGSITTTYAGGNGNDGAMFDVTALSSDILITGFDINCGIENTDPNMTVEVYYKAGTYVGFEANAGAWTFAGSEAIVCNPTGVPTALNVGGITIPAGETYGLYITDSTDIECVGICHIIEYTNGANTYANTEIQIEAGIGLIYPFSTSFADRIWNGTIYYEYTPTAVGGLNIPQLGLVKIDTATPTAAYVSPNGEQVRLANGVPLELPQDFNNDGFDTYVVTETALVDGRWWVSLFIGSQNFVWVPYDAVQPLNALGLE